MMSIIEVNKMNSANFNQVLCRDVSDNGENITGIFDTLVCKKGTNPIHICVLLTQILNDSSSNYDKYYYRIILRQLGNSREDMKNYRVDSGIFWDDEYKEVSSAAEMNRSKCKTTRPGSSGKLVIEYEHEFEVQGSYEVDLYVKKLEGTETQEDCEKLRVKDLELVSICPFNVIFQNS